MSFSICTSLILKNFAAAADPIRAEAMERYMRNLFPFYGVPSDLRKRLSKDALVLMKNEDQPFLIVRELYNLDQRELQYVAMDGFFKSRKKWSNQVLEELEWMITTKSWWDTVDFIASNCVGHCLKHDPQFARKQSLKWIHSENLWLRRTSLIFQLKYGINTDSELLTELINHTRHEKEFFIKKAIGWALRQYAKYNPTWVVDFVANTPLQALSAKEALKNIR